MPSRAARDPQRYYEYIRTDGLGRGPDDDPAQLRAVQRQIEFERSELERHLHEAEALIDALENEVRILTTVIVRRRQSVADEADTGASRKKLLVRARTILRRALHPDARPGDDARHATREFQDAEGFFERLMARSRHAA